MSHSNTQRGFTLIELLVVLIIIGVLAAVVLPAIQSARDKAVNTKRIAEADGVRKALEQYFNDFKTYPNDGVSNDEVLLSAISGSLSPDYISELPIDPVFKDTIEGYKYCVTDDLENYHLRVHLNDDNNASTTDYCGIQRGDSASSACPNAALDDLCSDRF